MKVLMVVGLMLAVVISVLAMPGTARADTTDDDARFAASYVLAAGIYDLVFTIRDLGPWPRDTDWAWTEVVLSALFVGSGAWITTMNVSDTGKYLAGGLAGWSGLLMVHGVWALVAGPSDTTHTSQAHGSRFALTPLVLSGGTRLSGGLGLAGTF